MRLLSSLLIVITPSASFAHAGPADASALSAALHWLVAPHHMPVTILLVVATIIVLFGLARSTAQPPR